MHGNAFNETMYQVPTTEMDSSLHYLNRIFIGRISDMFTYIVSFQGRAVTSNLGSSRRLRGCWLMRTVDPEVGYGVSTIEPQSTQMSLEQGAHDPSRSTQWLRRRLRVSNTAGEYSNFIGTTRS